MKRVIVDYSKLTSEILNLLVEKFPEGYDDSDIVRFKNAKNETIEAVEVKTEDTIYLVKVSTKLADRIVNFDDDEEMDGDDSLDALKELEIDADTASDEEKADKDEDMDDDDEDDDEEADSDDDDDEDDE